MSAEHAHKKDSRNLIKTAKATQERLAKMGTKIDTILADAGFSSGENYATLEEMGMNSYIPVHGTYKDKREGFVYDSTEDVYICEKNHKLEYRQTDKSRGYVKKRYLSRKKVCNKCPLREECVGRRGYKEISQTVYRKQYDDMIARLKTEQGQQSYALRMITVEPVFGTLQQHYGLRWINTRGIDLANKVMLMAASAVNLKKLVKSRLNSLLFKAFVHYSLNVVSYVQSRFITLSNAPWLYNKNNFYYLDFRNRLNVYTPISPMRADCAYTRPLDTILVIK